MAHPTRYAAVLVAFHALTPGTLIGSGAQGAGFRIQDLRIFGFRAEDQTRRLLHADGLVAETPPPLSSEWCMGFYLKAKARIWP